MSYKTLKKAHQQRIAEIIAEKLESAEERLKVKFPNREKREEATDMVEEKLTRIALDVVAISNYIDPQKFSQFILDLDQEAHMHFKDLKALQEYADRD